MVSSFPSLSQAFGQKERIHVNLKVEGCDCINETRNNLEVPMTLCFDNTVTDCTKVKLAVNTTNLFVRITRNCNQYPQCCLTY